MVTLSKVVRAPYRRMVRCRSSFILTSIQRITMRKKCGWRYFGRGRRLINRSRGRVWTSEQLTAVTQSGDENARHRYKADTSCRDSHFRSVSRVQAPQLDLGIRSYIRLVYLFLSYSYSTPFHHSGLRTKYPVYFSIL